MRFMRSAGVIGAAMAATTLTACQGDRNGLFGTGLFSDDSVRNPAPVADVRPAPNTAKNPAASTQPQQEPAPQSLELTSELIRTAQQQLNQNSGAGITVDGIWGNETSGAVREFQATRGLSVTGRLNLQTLAALGVDTGLKQ